MKQVSLSITVLLSMTVFTMIIMENIPSTSEVIPLFGKISNFIYTNIIKKTYILRSKLAIYNSPYFKNVISLNIYIIKKILWYIIIIIITEEYFGCTILILSFISMMNVVIIKVHFRGVDGLRPSITSRKFFFKYLALAVLATPVSYAIILVVYTLYIQWYLLYILYIGHTPFIIIICNNPHKYL